MRKTFITLLGLSLATACGGGGVDKAATGVTDELTVTSVEVSEPTVVLDFGVPEAGTSVPAIPSTTDGGSLFEGFILEEVDQSGIAINSDSPNVAKVIDETVFALDVPVACSEVPIGPDVAVKQIIFDLHWSCFFRPKIITDDNDWLLGLAEDRYDRSELRDKVANETRESDCMQGGSCDEIMIPLDLGENVRAECNFDSIVVPNVQVKTRLQSICSDDIAITVNSR